MICDAPEIRAPCTAERPIPPQPIITTDEPGLTLARLNTAPKPVTTAQPTNDAISSGTSSRILITDASATIT